jgi:hypothetical protein
MEQKTKTDKVNSFSENYKNYIGNIKIQDHRDSIKNIIKGHIISNNEFLKNSYSLDKLSRIISESIENYLINILYDLNNKNYSEYKLK